MSERQLTPIVDAILDGEDIDWGVINTGAREARVEAIKTLAAVSTLKHAPPRASTPPASRSAFLIVAGMGIVSALALLGVALSLAAGTAVIPPLFAIVALAFMLSGAPLARAGRRDQRARSLAGFFFTVVFSFSITGFGAIAATLDLPHELATFARALTIDGWLPFFLWQFARQFPQSSRFSRFDGWCRAGIVLAASSATFFTAVGLVHWRWPSVQAPLPFLPAGAVFWPVTFLCALPALAVIALRARQATGSERVRSRWFMFGIAGGLAPTAFEIALEGLSPSFRHYMDVASASGQLFWMSVFIYVPLISMPVIAAYSVLGRHVMGMGVAVRAGLRQLLARWLLTRGVAVPAVLLIVYAWINRALPLEVVLARPAARVLVTLSVTALVVLAIRPWLARLLDRWLFISADSPAFVMADLASSATGARSLLDLGQMVAKAAERATSSRASFLWRTEDGHYVPIGAHGAPVTAGSAIASILEGARGPAVLDATATGSLHPWLDHDGQLWVQTTGASAVCAVGAGGQMPFGALILEAPRASFQLADADLRLVQALIATVELRQRALAATPGVDSIVLAMQCTRCRRIDPWVAGVSVCQCTGTLLPAQVPLTIEGRYRVEQFLGGGGMGAVYRARDLRLDRDVAIKTLTGVSADAAERLMSEARTMARLTHANLAVLHSVELWHDTPLLVMEYFPAGSLADRLRRGPLNASELTITAEAIADGLEYLHRNQLLHGDVKPSNVAFTADGVAKLLDFGLTVAAVDDEPHQWGGTRLYLPPEVLNGARPSASADIWALGVMLIECAMGRHPLVDAEGRFDVSRPALDRLPSRLPAPWRECAARVLAYVPTSRHSSARAVADDIVRVAR